MTHHKNSTLQPQDTHISKTIGNWTHADDWAILRWQFINNFWVMSEAICEQLLGQATWKQL